MCIDKNFIAHKEKNDKIMASNIYGQMGQKGRDGFAGLIWKECGVWTSGKTLMNKMKKRVLTQGTKAFKASYSNLKVLYKLCEMIEEQ